VHTASLGADEGLIDFDLATELAALVRLEREPEARQHEPRGLLGDSERTAKLVAADPVLAGSDQPERGKPFLKADGRVLKDGSDLQREPSARVFLVALPAALLRKAGCIVSMSCAGPAKAAWLKPDTTYYSIVKNALIADFHQNWP
jgi:hypothetical protein